EGRSFCAGYDIGRKPDPEAGDWRSDPIKAHKHLAAQLDFEMAPWNMKKPVIASVQGHVMGGGCELVMLCDLTIAADSATFAEPEVRFSSVGPAIVMPAIIGYKRARELLYFGDAIDARTAVDIGMVNRVVPLAELREKSLAWAKRLSLISPEALYATKLAINRIGAAVDRELCRIERLGRDQRQPLCPGEALLAQFGERHDAVDHTDVDSGPSVDRIAEIQQLARSLVADDRRHDDRGSNTRKPHL